MNHPIIYHIMIDRFAGCAGKTRERCFNGGNLKSIIPRLDYIQQLGCTGIMLTPFYSNNEYHGYHVLDYTQVDKHFGTWDDVKQLVEAAHSRGMTITADFVPNHCHIDNPLIHENPHWFKRRADGSFKGFKGYGFLPQFNLDNKAAQDYMIARAKELCSCGFDSIRIDYAHGPSLKSWKRFRIEVKKEYPQVSLIGEAWGAPVGKHLAPELAALVKSGTVNLQEAWQLSYVDCLDGVLDFEYLSLLCQAARSGKGIRNNKHLYKQVQQHFARFADYPDFQLWLFLDNHDTNRFLYECGGDVQLLHEAIEFSLEQPYPFLLYYGTEKGMTNHYDRFDGTPYADEQVRQCMEWTKENIVKCKISSTNHL